MNAVPDYKPTVVAVCRPCGLIARTGETVCPECGSEALSHLVRLGADLLDPKDPRLEKYKQAGEL